MNDKNQMEPEKKSNGALVGLVVIVIILIMGAVYVWQSKVPEIQNQNESLNESLTELESLEAEIGSTDIDAGVDASTIE